MDLQIPPQNKDRVLEAIARRNELLRQRTAEMARDWSDELSRTESIIAAAVSVAVRQGAAR